jgi:hypothetical protein
MILIIISGENMALICKNLRVARKQILVDVGTTEDDGSAGALIVKISGYPDKSKTVYLSYPSRTEAIPFGISDNKIHTITAILHCGGMKVEKKIIVEL